MEGPVLNISAVSPCGRDERPLLREGFRIDGLTKNLPCQVGKEKAKRKVSTFRHLISSFSVYHYHHFSSPSHSFKNLKLVRYKTHNQKAAKDKFTAQ